MTTAMGRDEYSIAAALDESVDLGVDGRGRLEARATLQSWPGIVHGGGVVAILDEAARRLGAGAGPRRIEGRLTSSVPLETTLALDGRRGEGRVDVSVLDRDQPLASGAVTAIGPTGATSSWLGGGAGWALPMSETCLACGADNPLGLRAPLRFDADGVWTRLRPREGWRTGDDMLHPAFAPVILDEIAWWLGALVMKEGGLTNRIALDWVDPSAPAGTDEVVASGRFDEVTPVDRKRAFWRTPVALSTAGGRLLAAASIVFRGGPEYSTRQLAYFGSRTDPAVFRRMFPGSATGGASG
jgi:hypothetical protein